MPRKVVFVHLQARVNRKKGINRVEMTVVLDNGKGRHVKAEYFPPLTPIALAEALRCFASEIEKKGWRR